ncbi:hypothetical protein [Pseudomonas veronii]|uniref:hypothetical protein n=1 Tax=Pseudomonas veronii TaxID=76761 RepID=UPI000624F822|nr:hypothetical protein [Pseudomonas veronii]
MTNEKKNQNSKKKQNLEQKSNSGRTTDINNQEWNDAKLENDLIISQLHQTQEDLEQATYRINKKENEIIKLQKRINNFIKNNPNYWEAESIDAELIENTESKKTIQWNVKDSYFGEQLHRSLCFKTSYANGITGITFRRQGSTELIRFKTDKSCKELKCLPVPGSFASNGNIEISALSTSDWKTLNYLIPKLINALQNETIKNIQKDAATDTLNGLIKLNLIIKNWPNLLRYDSIKLLNTIDTPEYQALDLLLENLELNSKTISSFSYRLSSVNESGKAFGQYPRLEFPETSKSSFDNWFIEANDERGKRLELRFAEPDQMDINVWKKISDHDRLLIAATISKLPEKMSQLKGSHNNINWDNWINIANLVKNTLKKHVR